MKQFITVLIIGLLFPLCSMAQEDVTKKEVQENEVTIHQDDEINNLIFGEVEAVEDFEEEPVQQQVATPQKTNKATQSTRGTVRANRVANNTAVDVMREIDHRRFIEGFRIQVVSRGNTNKDHQEVRQASSLRMSSRNGAWRYASRAHDGYAWLVISRHANRLRLPSSR